MIISRLEKASQKAEKGFQQQANKAETLPLPLLGVTLNAQNKKPQYVYRGFSTDPLRVHDYSFNLCNLYEPCLIDSEDYTLLVSSNLLAPTCCYPAVMLRNGLPGDMELERRAVARESQGKDRVATGIPVHVVGLQNQTGVVNAQPSSF